MWWVYFLFHSNSIKTYVNKHIVKVSRCHKDISNASEELQKKLKKARIILVKRANKILEELK